MALSMLAAVASPASARTAASNPDKKIGVTASVKISHATVASRSTASAASGQLKLKNAHAATKTVKASSSSAGWWRFYSQQQILGAQIAFGPGHDIWLAAGRTIQRITSTGSVTTYTSPALTNASNPIAGPGGDLWFSSNNEIQRMTVSGTITTYELPCDCYPPSLIVVGPGGDIWWANTLVFGRLAPDGSYTTYTDKDFEFDCFGKGSDGAVWFGAGSTYVGRLTSGGKVTLYHVHGALNGLCSFTPGPGAAVWFTGEEGSATVLGRIGSTGTITTYQGRWLNYGLSSLVAGPNRTMWFNPFTQYNSLALGQITANGKAVIYLNTKELGSPQWLVLGPDRRLWFSTDAGGKVGVFTIPR